MNDDNCPESQLGHSWVAGMMRVHEEDLAFVAAQRQVECERCGYVYQSGGDGL